MKFAITALALFEIAVLIASAVALVAFGIRSAARRLRRLAHPEDEAGALASVDALLVQFGFRVSEEEVRRINAAVVAHARERNVARLSRAEVRELALSVLNRVAA